MADAPEGKNKSNGKFIAHRFFSAPGDPFSFRNWLRETNSSPFFASKCAPIHATIQVRSRTGTSERVWQLSVCAQNLVNIIEMHKIGPIIEMAMAVKLNASQTTTNVRHNSPSHNKFSVTKPFDCVCGPCMGVCWRGNRTTACGTSMDAHQVGTKRLQFQPKYNMLTLHFQ